MSPVWVYAVPWDATTTHQPGTANAPQAMQTAMGQLDPMLPFTDALVDLIWCPPSPDIVAWQHQHAPASRGIMDACNAQIPLTTTQQASLAALNIDHHRLHETVHRDCATMLANQQPLILCGGEHGVGLGYLWALSEQHNAFGVLQVDAHMDCRDAYFGYRYSHASVATHYAAMSAVSAMVQVGIRDYHPSEVAFQDASSTPFTRFTDAALHEARYQGTPWAAQCQAIVDALPERVMISLDVDGLCPADCPGTGTPVPGGLTYNECAYLLQHVARHRQVIGAELVEVSGDHALGANIGARVLCGLASCL